MIVLVLWNRATIPCSVINGDNSWQAARASLQCPIWSSHLVTSFESALKCWRVQHCNSNTCCTLSRATSSDSMPSLSSQEAYSSPTLNRPVIKLSHAFCCRSISRVLIESLINSNGTKDALRNDADMKSLIPPISKCRFVWSRVSAWCQREFKS